MSAKTQIEWTRGDDGSPGATWNPVVGCRRVSEGCRNCYAETVAAGNVRRLRGVVEKTGSAKAKATLAAYEHAVRMDADGNPRPLWSGRAIERPEMLDQPMRWAKPRRIFVNSMSDLFHEDVSFGFIAAVFGVMSACPQHTFQVLTKRPERMLEWFTWLDERSSCTRTPSSVHVCAYYAAKEVDGIGYSPLDSVPSCPLPNVHIGVSVEDQQTADERIPLLLQCPAAVRWVSAEPLLGPVDFESVRCRDGQTWKALTGACEWHVPAVAGQHDGGIEGVNVDGIDWIVVGGESGPGARPMHPQWVRDIRDQCADADVPFFFKQWGEWVDDAVQGAPNTWVAYDGTTDDTLMGAAADGAVAMSRVGKKRAGRLLDGVEHSDGPREVAPC